MANPFASFTKARWLISVASLAVIVCGAAWSLSTWFGGDDNPDHPRRVWFYDTTTGSLFVEMSDRVAPIESPAKSRESEGKPTGVRAYLFSCGSCSDEKERFIGYFETHTKAAQDAIINRPPDREGVPPVDISSLVDEGTLVAKPVSGSAELVWVVMVSSEGQAIMRDAVSKPCADGKLPVQCRP